jgi:hypothetical protein
MVAVGMNPMPSKIIGRRLVYELYVLFDCQKILEPRSTQTFERGKNQKK